ncbi:MAG: 50S ribosomal protein L40e [Candidatus Aenigmarchaeota archaeon]|nr:50S ribosomal protein L40e [Candidatus Aenigmarchaeota archaeon]
MAKKLPEIVAKRLYENVYVCMRCNAKLRTTLDKVKRKKAKCRKCGSKNLRLKAKERRGAKA